MRVLTITELANMTRIELAKLAQQIADMLPGLPEGSLDRSNAVISLRNIRLVLTRTDCAVIKLSAVIRHPARRAHSNCNDNANRSYALTALAFDRTKYE